jgi:hypothetical protein
MTTNIIKVAKINSPNITTTNIVGSSSLVCSNNDQSNHGSINALTDIGSVINIKANKVTIDDHLSTESIARILNFFYKDRLDSIINLINENIDPKLEYYLVSFNNFDKNFIIDRFEKNISILQTEEKDWESYKFLFEFYLSKFSTRSEFTSLLGLLPDSEKTPYWHSSLTEMINRSRENIRYYKDFILD